MSNPSSGRLEQFHLSSPSTRQPWQHYSTSMIPLRELFTRDRIRRLSIIQSLDQSRRTGGATAHIESPAHECAILVWVELYGRGDVFSDALLSDLEMSACLHF
jgi:hypothetical protein